MDARDPVVKFYDANQKLLRKVKASYDEESGKVIAQVPPGARYYSIDGIDNGKIHPVVDWRDVTYG
jgi:hypothetical protein